MHFTAETTWRWTRNTDVRIRRLFTLRVWGAVVYRWIVGAVAGLVGVSGCRIQVAAFRWARGHGGGGGGGGGSVAVCVGQAALDGELQQLVITQVTVERIILEGQSGSRRSGVRNAGCRHDGALRSDDDDDDESEANSQKEETQLQVFISAD